MRLDRMSITLRPRTPWEAMDLGLALVRRHAGAIWPAWFALTLPVWLLANAAAWWLGKPYLAALLLWWLKPLFDRVPLYVLSRAVFGQVPGLRQTLRAPELWSAGPLLGWLTWRRWHPSRALLLPVDMLEGLRGPRRRARATLLQRTLSAQALGLTLVFANFELLLFCSAWVLGLMFVPTEFLSESARAVWMTFFESPPAWAQVVANAVAWLAMSLVEPFYVGAGFGLYLNRRTQLEAWDVELAFRRLADRAAALAPMLALVLMFSLPMGARAASPTAPVVAHGAKSLTSAELVGPAWQAHDSRFARAAEQALRDPLLSPKQTVTRWVPKSPTKPTPADPGRWAWMRTIGTVIGLLGEYGLWLLAALLLAFVLWRLPHWLPWVRAQWSREVEPTPITEWSPLPVEPLPADVAGAARELWRQERRREALALVYRASVERIETRLGSPFPPGATEAECLRRARKLPDRDHETLFVAVVRAWQGAAYARRFPDTDVFEALLQRWSLLLGAVR